MNEISTLSDQLKSQDYIDPAMISSALDYWFSDNAHIRSPFPESIREKLAEDAVAAILRWAAPLSDAAKKEMNDEMLAEKFEEILFETALMLVADEDEKITIRYPFMPRVGDPVSGGEEVSMTTIIRNRRIEKRGDEVFLVVEHAESGSETSLVHEFELPE